MIIFPAIDLKQGKCVRLFKGDMNQATIFNDNPAAQALEFEKAGFKFLHIVDLDGAIQGSGANSEAVKNILKTIKIPAQLGGGIRNLQQIEDWLNLGLNRVILGTVAAKNPELVKEACKKFPNKIVVGIDSLNDKVMVDGWVKESTMTTLELAKKFEDCGVCAIIYTDISRDGTLQGPNIPSIKNLAQNLKIPVIASGGVSNLQDVLELKKIEKEGVEGVIIGRALYDKKVLASDLIAL